LKIIKANENSGHCLMEMKLDDSNFMNIKNVLHGGVIASLIDIVSTASLYNTTARKTGASIDIHLS
jgi:acyl-coenzyme A thioesterase PaaI-like protein